MIPVDWANHIEPDLNSGCWLWNGSIGAGGYGTVSDRGKNRKAHRVSWAQHNGAALPPPHIKVCHRCDTPACVNPAHLFLGTQADNVADMVAKGRQRGGGLLGSAHPRARLDEQSVSDIRLILSTGVPQRPIARLYGVSPMTISRIASNKLWTHVE